MPLFEPFDFQDGALAPSEVNRARRAIGACHSCPRLQACKSDTASAIDGSAQLGLPPVAVVQAGVLFDESSRPYGRTPTSTNAEGKRKTKTSEDRGRRPRKKSDSDWGGTAVGDTAALELPIDINNTVPAVNAHAVEWVPDIDLSPVRINWRGVYLALGPNAVEQTVTRHVMLQAERRGKPPIDPGVREVLERHDELEVVRLGVERGMPLHRIAANLCSKWHRMDRICTELGIIPTHRR